MPSNVLSPPPSRAPPSMGIRSLTSFSVSSMGDRSGVSTAIGITYYRLDCKLHVMEDKRAGHELFEVELIF